MANKQNTSDSTITDRVEAFGQDAADRARKGAEWMSDAARNAAGRFEDGRSVAADKLESAASTMEQKADDLPGGETVKDFARATADRLSSTADYVRSHDVNRMMADVETVVKNNPGPALLAAAAFGFLIGRSLTRA